MDSCRFTSAGLLLGVKTNLLQPPAQPRSLRLTQRRVCLPIPEDVVRLPAWLAGLAGVALVVVAPTATT